MSWMSSSFISIAFFLIFIVSTPVRSELIGVFPPRYVLLLIPFLRDSPPGTTATLLHSTGLTSLAIPVATSPTSPSPPSTSTSPNSTTFPPSFPSRGSSSPTPTSRGQYGTRLGTARPSSPSTSRDHLYRYDFKRSRLRSVSTDLGDGTLMHCWVLRPRKDVGSSRTALVLMHGFDANAMWQYSDVLHFTVQFDVYVPNLVFFGRLYTLRLERTMSFQAQCLKGMMERFGVMRMSLVGISYGGFVGYEMAAEFPGEIDKLVLCCSGVCLEEKDPKDGLFQVSSLDEAAEILMPQTPAKQALIFPFFGRESKEMGIMEAV